MAAISAIIITRNEAHNIAACIDSLRCCDEVIVLDSGSTDATCALALATRDWVLSIDADERLTPELADEIARTVAGAPSFNAYAIPRLSRYCGQYMRHGDWNPDLVVRLFRRTQARFSDDIVHETLCAEGPRGRLRGTLLHDSFRDLDEVLDKLNAYSRAGALKMHARGRRGGVGRAVLHGAWTFVRGYVLRLGWLDGRLGFVLAVSNAQGAYYRYLKLWLLQRAA